MKFANLQYIIECLLYIPFYTIFPLVYNTMHNYMYVHQHLSTPGTQNHFNLAGRVT